MKSSDPWASTIHQAMSICRKCVVFIGPHPDGRAALDPLRNRTLRDALQQRQSEDSGFVIVPVVLPGVGADDFDYIHPSAVWLKSGEGSGIENLCRSLLENSLRIFLCHSSGDKEEVRRLYAWLTSQGYSPWLDERHILPGQNWEDEIRKAVRTCDIVLVCLSPNAVNTAGYLQKELREVLDAADYQPEGKIFLIPVKLSECEVPIRLRRWQWVELYKKEGYDLLQAAFRSRAYIHQAISGDGGGGSGGSLYSVKRRADSLLIVDDNRDLLHYLVRLLDTDFEVKCAESVSAARDVMDENVNVILLDYMLPDGNGVELAVDFSATYTNVQIIVTTGTILPPEEEALCEEHGFPVLRKPFLSSEVSGMIKARGRGRN